MPTFNGTSSNDTLTGTVGDDLINGLDGNDNLNGDGGNDTLNGGDGEDTIEGGEGQDVLTGDAGADLMRGGLGGDTYYVDELDTVEEADQGTGDEVRAGFSYTLGANLEGLHLTGTADVDGSGNELVNFIWGNSGDNVLRGFGNRDYLFGWDGNDELFGGDTYGDNLHGGAGDDLLDGGAGSSDRATYGFGATSGVTVNLSISGPQNTVGAGFDTLVGIEDLEGTDFGDTLIGNDEANRLDGSGGIDTLEGQGGDDTYFVHDPNDIVIEQEGGGTDTVSSFGSYDLPDNVERLLLARVGPGELIGRGNALDNTINGSQAYSNTIYGGAGNDTLNGGGAVDILVGEQGNDALYGHDGDDTLSGNDGNDFLSGGAGADTLAGGQGNDIFQGGTANLSGDTITDFGAGDRIVFVNATLTGFSFSLSGNTLTYSGGSLTLTGFSGYLVASAAAGGGVQLTVPIDGTADNDTLTGTEGNDVINGFAGDDQIDGGAGDDTLNGGAGNDIFVVDSELDAVHESVGGGADTIRIAPTGLPVRGPEPVQPISDFTYALATGQEVEMLVIDPTVTGWVSVIGNELDNHIIGNDIANYLFGGSGADHLEGGGGDDILISGEGSDILEGGAGSDHYTLWNPYVVVVEAEGEGLDFIDILESYTLPTGVEVEFLRLPWNDTAPDSLTGNEFGQWLLGSDGNNQLNGLGGNDEIYGRFGNDTLNGGDGDDYLSGEYNDDLLYGGIGDDILLGGDGNDLLDGGEGSDRLDFWNATTGVNVSLAMASPQDTNQGLDTLVGIEHLGGSDHADVLIGNHGANELSGAGSSDQLFGAGGDDRLRGGAGIDTLIGGTGNDIFRDTAADLSGDTITDFAGGDRIVITNASLPGFSYSLSGNTLTYTGGSLTLAGFTGQLQVSTAAEGGVQLTQAPLVGTAGDDVLTGTDGEDAISGLEGNDQISGGGGNDSLSGDGGTDFLRGGAGDDLLDGGAGGDRALYDDALAGVTVNLVTGVAMSTVGTSAGIGADQLIGVEWVTGGSFDDVIIGDGGFNILRGGAGNDTMDGAGDDDALIGGEGNDQLIGGAGDDQLLGESGDDFLDGGTGADQMDGGTGDDTYVVDHGLDVVAEEPGAGTDTVQSSFGVDMSVGSFFVGEIENIVLTGTATAWARGNDLANLISGNSAANELAGRGGDDRLAGGLGNDTLTGGVGRDTFRDTAAGLNGDTITDLGAGDRIVIRDATLAGFSFSWSGNTLTFTGGSLTLTGFTGQLQASAAADGGVQLTAAPKDVRNDFNGDGRSDILWRNDNGTVKDWLGQADGSFADNAANTSISTRSSWHIAGIGDFNGDGRDDVLWRSDDGTVKNWLGKANGGFVGNDANTSIDTRSSWHIAGIGDFNGDGRDDVLWRSDDGTVKDWLGKANGGFVGNDANTSIEVDNSQQVASIGDFNGDGRDDVLWRSANGTVTEWLGQAGGGFQENPVVDVALATGWHAQSPDLWM